MDICHRWCKLNFAPFQGQNKSCHFSERKGVKRQYFYFLYIFLEIFDRKQLGQPFFDTDFDFYFFLNRILLDLNLDNYCWIQKIRKYLTLLLTTLAPLTTFYSSHVWPRKTGHNVLLIAKQIIHKSLHAFLTASLLG